MSGAGCRELNMEPCDCVPGSGDCVPHLAILCQTVLGYTPGLPASVASMPGHRDMFVSKPESWVLLWWRSDVCVQNVREVHAPGL